MTARRRPAWISSYATAPHSELAGRIALHGKLLFNRDPSARVTWEVPLTWRAREPQATNVAVNERCLVLLRHAKSAYPAGVPDHERPLAPRGGREAALAGDWLRANLPTVDAVLCSTAVRTRDTLAHTGIEAPVRYLDRLYEATLGAVFDEINTVDGGVRTLLVIGHEPTMSQLALGMAAIHGTDPRAEARVATKFPTSGIAVLHVGRTWRDLGLGGAALVAFHVPR